MKAAFLILALIGSAVASPVSKVLDLLADLESKIVKDGEGEQKAHEEYVAWCKDGATKKGFEIETAKSDIEGLKASISKADSVAAAAATKAEELAGSIAANEADLKAATNIRSKEVAEFEANEAELVDTIGTLDRAINVLQRQAGSALLQARVNNGDMVNLVHVLSTVVDATALSLHDKQKLIALAQSGAQDGTSDDATDMELGAPAGAAYESKSGNIVDILEDLREKAEASLSDARREEVNAKHNYEMLAQSLNDDIKFGGKELGEAKASGSAAAETKASAEGDLASTEKTLADAEAALETIQSGCASAAADHKASVEGRTEELAALGKAKQVLTEMTSGAEAVAYSSASFVQIGQQARLATRADLANVEVVQLLRQLSRREGSAALAQLASRVASVVSFASAGGEDPFQKVKNLISDMVSKLEADAVQDANHNEWCEEQMGDTQAKNDDLSQTIKRLSVKIDKATSRSASLKDEAQALQADLAELTKSQAECDKVRKAENSAFVQTKTDLAQGIKGVRMALKVLRDYYGGASLVQQSHEKDTGAGQGIIGMLEVCEEDFGKSLSEAEMDEDAAATEYQKVSMMNKMSKATYEKDVEYKRKEATSLDKAVTDLSSDRSSAQTELDAVLEYSKTVRGACEVKPEAFGDRKARRDTEIAGLKNALEILAGENALLQKPALRGSAVARHSQ